MKYSDKISNMSEINQNVVAIWVKENIECPGNKTIISWNVIKVGEREVSIKINFAEPSEISNDKVIYYF